ncbi:MAG: aldehyde dehydrogenase family protein, partial [Williamsia herbipolensis]|nr:aldehyde dehydrogenase family protein [Williamsia herbipolensis]
MAIATINPATGETVKTFDALNEGELEDKLERAAQAFRGYRLSAVEDRVGWLNAAADLLDKENEQVAELMTLEMGKTYTA